MADQQKDTLYIDIDDEITAIIDKVRGSSNKVVALVLPKRATTLQSIVNMKLLKRAADESKKNLVLVTTESGLLPLAGAVGLHVAKTPNSRPEIPVAPGLAAATDSEEAVDLFDDDEASPQTADTAGDKPVGELAGSTMPLPTKPTPASGIETVELDNAEPVATPAAAAVAAKAKPKKDKKLHVPDFDKFRLLLIFGGALLVVLIIFGYLALVVLPKASIDIQTNASNVNTNVDFTLSTSASSLNASSKVVPAKQVQSQKTYTGTANATGQKNNGDKATGSVTFTNCSSDNTDIELAAGTGISSGGQTYILQSRVSLPFSGHRNNGSCTSSNGVTTQSANVSAQAGGTKYNTSGNTNFTVSGYSSGDLKATSSGGISGGTDDIQTVVTQGDIDSAKSKINTTDTSVQNDLKGQLEDQGLLAIGATYNTGQPSVTNSSKVGDAASSVTVTESVTFTMLGANESDIKTLVDADIKDQIDTGAQSILSRGITQGAFKLKDATSSGASMNIQTTAEVGPAINTENIAQAAAGKKSGDIESEVKSNPDITDVTVKLSPFWVSHAPKNVKKITVTVAKPSTSKNGN